jgi:hypothetical protein
MTKSENDLVAPVPPQVVDSQRPAVGQALIYESDGFLHSTNLADNLFLATRAARRVRAECQWFEKLITHGPSVGTFYESLLASTISELLPSKYKIGSGFVYDTQRQLHSKQIDILVYDDSTVAPLYQRDGFVVVPSSTVKGVAEVKKTLTHAHLRELIAATFSKNLGTNATTGGLQYLPIFAFDAKGNTESHFETIKDSLIEALKPFVSRTVGGADVTFGMRHLVLPRVYYLDRPEWIGCRLHREESGSYRVKITTSVTLDENEGLSLFLSDLVPTEPASVAAEKNFLSHQFLGPSVKSEVIEQDIVLYREVSMATLIDLFPHDLERLRSLRVGGNQPFAANISSHTDLSRVASVDALMRTPGFQWCIWDTEKGELNVVTPEV